METPISRRTALGLALAAVPCAAGLLAPQEANASTASLEATQIALDSSIPEDAVGPDGASEPSAVSYADVSILASGKEYGSDWSAWRSAKTVGSLSGKGLVSLKFKLRGQQGIAGSVRYRVYRRGSGWQDAVGNGKATPEVRNIEAVKIKLTDVVAVHYDVLYRVYMSGSGWSKWTKNGGVCGAIDTKQRVNAIQVKLSGKTQESIGKSTGAVGIRYEARVMSAGWQPWVSAGETAGTTGKAQTLSSFAVFADHGKLGGSVKYRAHSAAVGWKDWKTAGKAAGLASKQLEAICIKLTGKMATRYDIYYRAHVESYGWLDWAKNGMAAGSTGYALRCEAFEVRLVKKGGKAPGKTDYPTVNKLLKYSRLNGVDIASYQGDNGISVAGVSAQFVIVKASQGNWYTNPYFYEHADAALASGKLLGTYHYADLEGSAAAQADYYISRVRPYLGQCILVLDWEAEALGLGPAWAKKFLDRVYSKTGVKPLIYLSQSATKDYNWSSIAPKYRLWVAQYLYRNMYTGYLGDPEGGTDLGYWPSATMYQYSSTGHIRGYGYEIDMNKFYGSAALWRQLSSKA